ncbi:MAG: chloride channel protein [Prevotella sp.]|nr:chloride channel protein [Prevotella sp.]
MTYVLAFIIGILAAVAGYVLHSLIRLIQRLLTEDFLTNTANWLYLVFPVIGIYLTSLFIKYVVRDNISHGITRVLYAISTKNSQIKRHNTWSSVLASAITIGFGGSVGAEAPIVLTGAAIGSNLGQIFRMNKRTVMLLVGCGAAAAISGIFKAPIAGLVFTLEVLMIDMTMASLVPILIASITADIFSYIFTGTASLFTFHLDSAWDVNRIPATILLGVFCGVVSLYFMRTMTFCEDRFARMKEHPYQKLFMGGLLLSSLIFLFPSLYGEGYNSLAIFINGQTEADWSQVMNGSLFYGHSELLVVYLALVMLTKIIATSSTNGAGGCGGTFAPSLFVGGFAGFLFARVWNIEKFGNYLPEKNFTLLGMAGVMAGVMHAPLTGIFLIAEITGGYALFVPLIIVSVVSVMVISIFEPHSIYAMRLAREGKLLTHHTDRSVLTLMSMDSVIEKEMTTVPPNMPMGKLINVLTSSTDSLIPVVDESGRLLGLIDITKIRHIVFRTELYHRFKANQLMTPVPAILYDNEPMEEVMEAFDKTNAEALPVVDINNHLKGYISKTRMYKVYRELVADYSAE